MLLDLALTDDIFIMNELDAAIQELDILFNTENTELLGYPFYGTNWHQFLWQMTPSPDDLKQYIYEKLVDTYYLSRMQVDIEVMVVETEDDMVYIVTCEVEDHGETKYRRYKLS